MVKCRGFRADLYKVQTSLRASKRRGGSGGGCRGVRGVGGSWFPGSPHDTNLLESYNEANPHFFF